MIVASTKVLHKELVALAESGAVPGYTPSSLAQLQAVAGALGLCLHAVGAEGANVDAGLGECVFLLKGAALGWRAVGMGGRWACPTHSCCACAGQRAHADGMPHPGPAGLFPALTSFPHSCVPNCNFLVIGEAAASSLTLHTSCCLPVRRGFGFGCGWCWARLPMTPTDYPLRLQIFLSQSLVLPPPLL